MNTFIQNIKDYAIYRKNCKNLKQQNKLKSVDKIHEKKIPFLSAQLKKF